MSTHIKAERLGFRTLTPIEHPEQFIVRIYVNGDTIIEANVASYRVEPDPEAHLDSRQITERTPAMRSYFEVPTEELKVLFNIIEEACRFNPGATDENLAKFLAEALGDRAYKMGQWITEASTENSTT